jgi:hypothetical protein
VRFELLTAVLMRTHGISLHADWKIFIEFLEEYSPFVVRVKQSRALPGLLTLSPGLLDPDNEGAVFCRNVGEY